MDDGRLDKYLERKQKQMETVEKVIWNIRGLNQMSDEDVKIYNLNQIQEDEKHTLDELLGMLEETGGFNVEFRANVPEKLERKLQSVREYICGINGIRFPELNSALIDPLDKTYGRIYTRKMSEQEYQWLLNSSPEEIVDEWIRAYDLEHLKRVQRLNGE